jgi:carbon-monoxide dehydrogenase large subunit
MADMVEVQSARRQGRRASPVGRRTTVTEAALKYVGGGVVRKEDPNLVTGKANWTDNIKLPAMLHMTLLRSPFAHARITSIDVSAAKEQPGVVAVFTHDDLAQEWPGA